MTRAARIGVYAAIFLSGAAALVYEVVWSRQLSVFLGITLRAEAVVLAAFMLGLALGNRFLGGLADRVRSPLLLFAALEATIGLYAIVSRYLLPALAPWYGSLATSAELSTAAGYGLRFGVASAAVLLPTFLMGGTIPALIRALAGNQHTAPTIGLVWGANTLGAAFGAFAAGFVALPALGTSRTLFAGAAVNFLVAGLSWFLVSATVRSADSVIEQEATFEKTRKAATLRSPREREQVFLVFALFGAAALAIQLGWIQALSQIIGSSVYAFSLTLSGYLTGLALGGLVFARWAKMGRTGSGALIVSSAGFAVLAGLSVFDRLPELFLQAFRWQLESQTGLLVLFALLVCWSLILAPTTLFGFLSPLLASRCTSDPESAGRDVGAAFAANTAGTTVGALAAGFWALPNLGAQTTLRLAAAALVLAGTLLIWSQRPRSRYRVLKAFGPLVLFGFASIAIPRWEPAFTTSGPFINASRILDLPGGAEFRDAIRERNQVLFYRESAIGSVSVREAAGDRLLVINGKTDGSRRGDARTQLALGHLPVLLHPEPKTALVVGFGTGMTPAAVASHDTIERLDVVEISPEVVEASQYFAEENRGVLFDPKLRLHYADARNYLLASGRSWDVIVSEPSNPWISGVANLFTREYFELARDHLTAGGVMSQWFQTYGMATEDLRSVIGTFSGVFEQMTVWSPQPGDLVLVGSREKHALELSRLKMFETEPILRRDLQLAEWSGGEAFIRMLLMDSQAAAGYGVNAPPNTDEFPRVEFNAPKNLYKETTFANMLALVEEAGDRETNVPVRGLVEVEGATYRTYRTWGLASSVFALEPQVLTRWTVLQAAHRGPLPTLAVSMRRIVHARVPEKTAADDAPIEIEVFRTAAAPDRQALIERLRTLTEEEITDWTDGRLADGTSTVRAHRGTQDPGGVTGISWSCPDDAGFGVYVGWSSGRDVERTEAGLSCAGEFGWL